MVPIVPFCPILTVSHVLMFCFLFIILAYFVFIQWKID